MKKEEDKKLVLMQCRVNRETAERVDHICKRCGIASRYELMGYLLSCFNGSGQDKRHHGARPHLRRLR